MKLNFFFFPVAVLFQLSNTKREWEQLKHLNNTTLHTAQTNRKEQHDASCPPCPLPIQPCRQQMAVSPTMPCGRRCQQKRWQTLCRCLSLCVRGVCAHYVCVCVCDAGQRASFLQGKKSVIDSRGQPAGRKCHRMLNGLGWHRLAQTVGTGAAEVNITHYEIL